MTVTSPEPPRWRLTVHHRDFGTPTAAHRSGLGELVGARSRRLETTLNGSATLTWTTDNSPAAALPVELTTDVMAWRNGRLMFRGVVAQTEDTISEQAHAINWTAHDYLSVLARRYITSATGATFTATDQDTIIAALAARGSAGFTTANGTALLPGSNLPLVVARTNPDGTERAQLSGVVRDRTYTGGKSIGEAISDLTGVVAGVDISVDPMADVDGLDRLRVWYSERGEARDDVALVYGVTVAGLTRAVNSQNYANYVRVLGQSPATEGAPQLIAEAWNADAAGGGGTLPVGLWATTEAASDVSDPTTLAQKAAGTLAQAGTLVPTYSLRLRPGWYGPGQPALGDTVPLIVRSPPRLDISTTVRVVALNYAIGDDGQEDVEMTVGAPPLPLTAYFAQMRRDIGALARR